MKSAPSSAIAIASMRRLMRFMRPMSMLPVICSAKVARPSWVSVARGEDSARLGSTTCSRPLSAVSECTRASWWKQLVAVVVAELGAVAQANAGRAGRGLGDQVGIEFDRDHPRLRRNRPGRPATAAASAVAETGICSSGASSSWSSSLAMAMKWLRRLTRGRAVAGQHGVGRAEQRHRMRASRGVPRLSSNCAATAQLRVDSIR